MKLPDALDAIADYLHLDAALLAAYVAEDAHIGGHHSDAALSQWPSGSVWEIEGQVLYALVRALKPARILEVGMCYGCSTSHLGEAVLMNGNGHITSVDIYPQREIQGRYTDVATLLRQDIFDHEWQPYDFVFEDAIHSVEMTQNSWQNFERTAPSGAVIVSHDSEHFLVGAAVRAGIRAVTENYLSLLIDPALCGLAIWRKP